MRHKSYREIIAELELVIDDNEKRGIILKPFNDLIAELKKHATNIYKIEENIDAIREEVIDQIKRDLEKTRKVGKFSILGFYIGAVGLIASVASFNFGWLRPAEILKENTVVIAPYKNLLPAGAYAAFSDPSIDASGLRGEWVSIWCVLNRTTGVVTTIARDPIRLETANAQISAWATGSQRIETYWLEGRISSHGRITMTYWSQLDDYIKEYTGVVFLSQKESTKDRSKIYLYGRWIGRAPRPDESGDQDVSDVEGFVLFYRPGDLEALPDALSVADNVRWVIDLSLEPKRKDQLRNAHNP